MKKFTLSLSILLIGLLSTNAQNLSNGDFENFGDFTFTTWTLNGSSFNSSTCQNDGGTLNNAGMVTPPNRPVGFNTTDDQFSSSPGAPFYVTQTTDANSGSSAALLVDDGFGAFGIVGLFEPESLVQETVPVSYPFTSLGVPSSIDGFYKHTSGTPRTFSAGTCTNDGVLTQSKTFTGGFRVFAEMYDSNGAIVATVDTTFPDASSYTSFSAPVTVVQTGVVPTEIIFVMSSCPEFQSPNPILIPGSSTTIDDVDFIFATASIEDNYSNRMQLVQNPVQNLITIENYIPNTEVAVYDISGRVIDKFTKLDNAGNFTINATPGLYIIQIGNYAEKLLIK